MLPGTFPSVRPTKCGSLPTPSKQHVCRRPQRQASITHSDEVPQVKVENRETAAPLARACVRACQSVSVFCLHLFTHMPQNSDSQINRGEGFAQKPPHFAFSSGLFHRPSAVFQRFVPFHHKKWEIRSMSATAETIARCAFFEQGFGRRRNAQTFHSRRVAKHIFCRSVPIPTWQPARISTSKWGEAVVTVLPHGRTRKHEPKSTKPSHLSNYYSTLCAIRVKR